MECKHQAFNIVTQYFKDDPARVISAKCALCGEDNKQLVQIMQEREGRIFKDLGNKSPVVWLGEDESRAAWKVYTKEELAQKLGDWNDI